MTVLVPWNSELPLVRRGDWYVPVTPDARLPASFERLFRTFVPGIVQSWNPFRISAEKRPWLSWIARQLRLRFEDYDPSVEVPPPGSFSIPGLSRPLFPHQEEAVRFLVEKRRAVLADEMGLGKTISAIAATQWLGFYPALVVAPASLLDHWAETWLDWVSGPLRVEPYWPDWQLLPVEKRPHVLLLSWDGLRRTGGEVGWVKTLILDEAHFAKNQDAQRTEAAFRACLYPYAVFALTGTPVINDPEELVTLAKVLRVVPESTEPSWESAETIAREFVLRREKRDVLSLPEKRREIEWLPVPDPVKLDQALETFRAWWRSRHPELDSLPLADAIESIARSEQAKGLLKLAAAREELWRQKEPFVLDWIDWFLADRPNEKLVVLCRSLRAAETIARECSGLLLTGKVRPEDRHEIVRAFQEDPNKRLIVLTYGTGGLGLTLTAARTLVVVELPWTHAELIQGEDRIHRIGQEHPVEVKLLLADHELERQALERLERKAELERILR